ncbi:MAG: hypothetical protein ABI634_16010 [Acidobacteriota bacterium]
MTRTGRLALAFAFIGATAVPAAQAPDAAGVLAPTREALGGLSRIAAMRTLVATGRTRSSGPNGAIEDHDFELSIALPDRVMKRSVLMAMGPTSVYRLFGFNGDTLINIIDTPPALMSGGDGGNVFHIEIAGPGANGAARTPEEIQAANSRLLAEARLEFAQFTLGMFASSFAGVPLTFASGGRAESPDGMADVIDVAGPDELKARLFVDATSHMPLFLSWMAKEPLEVRIDNRGDGRGEQVQVFRGGGSGPVSGPPMNPSGPEMAARIREAEAARRIVEYRVFYGDYRTYDGVKLPTRLTRTVDGKPRDEIVFDRIRVNPRIDAKTFSTTK